MKELISCLVKILKCVGYSAVISITEFLALLCIIHNYNAMGTLLLIGGGVALFNSDKVLHFD